jgi:hypothetical protein
MARIANYQNPLGAEVRGRQESHKQMVDINGFDQKKCITVPVIVKWDQSTMAHKHRVLLLREGQLTKY